MIYLENYTVLPFRASKRRRRMLFSLQRLPELKLSLLLSPKKKKKSTAPEEESVRENTKMIFQTREKERESQR